MTPVTSAATRTTSARPTYVYLDSASMESDSRTCSLRASGRRSQSRCHRGADREVGLDPRVVDCKDLADGAVGKDRAAPQHDDAVDHGQQRVQIVGHEEDGDAEIVDERADEGIERARRGGIET